MQLTLLKKFSCIGFQTRFKSTQLAENAILLAKTLPQLAKITVQLAKNKHPTRKTQFQTKKLHKNACF
jgi:hypothetical protein